MIVAFTHARRTLAAASVPGMADLLFEALVGSHTAGAKNDGGEDERVSRVLVPSTRAVLTRRSRPRREKKSSSIIRLPHSRRLCGSLQARRQDFVDTRSRLHSTRGTWYGAHKPQTSSIGQTEINV